MVKFFSALVAALLAFVAFGANAGLGRVNPDEQAFVKDGEYLTIKSYGNTEAYSAVVEAILRASYRTTSNNELEPGTKTDTWCRVDVYRDRQILGECYTPHMGRGVAVRDHLVWTEQEFKSDYSGVPAMVTKIRDDHRRATRVLNQKPAQVLFVPTF